MRKILGVMMLVGTVAAADTPRLKSAAEVYAAPNKATAVELNLATLDIMTLNVRLAASTGDQDTLRKALVLLRDTANLMLKDMEPAPTKAP